MHSKSPKNVISEQSGRERLHLSERKRNKSRQIQEKSLWWETSQCRDINYIHYQEVDPVCHYHKVITDFRLSVRSVAYHSSCILCSPFFSLPTEILFPGQGCPQVWQVQCWCEYIKLLAVHYVGLSVTEDFMSSVIYFLCCWGSVKYRHKRISPMQIVSLALAEPIKGLFFNLKTEQHHVATELRSV